MLFCGNWASYDTLMWHHFACSLKSGDVGYWGSSLPCFHQQPTLLVVLTVVTGILFARYYSWDYSPSLQKASRSNPHPHFSNACQMTSHRCVIACSVSEKKQLLNLNVIKVKIFKNLNQWELNKQKEFFALFWPSKLKIMIHNWILLFSKIVIKRANNIFKYSPLMKWG